MERDKIIFVILFVLIANNVANTTKLNYPRVLLPIFDKISIEFNLEVIEKGCFRWTSSRYDLISITPLFGDVENECSHQAIVTVLTRERSRNVAIVLAEDIVTGETLRCDVILDVIDHLGVEATTRQLYLEEAPEAFEIRAEDSQGNSFTTLEGVEFNWAISALSSDSKNWSPALRFLTFTESAYHVVPPALEKIESQGLKGYVVLLEGINTGTAKVTVNIAYPECSHLPKLEIYINVLANIILEPSEAYILKGDTIDIRIFQLKMGKMHEITINQYYLEIEDLSVATLRTNSVTGLKLGQTSVVLRDRNAPESSVFIDSAVTKSAIPHARITVVNPMKLGISLLPHNNWITVTGEKHEIAFDLYTRNEQKITLGTSYSIKSNLDEALFSILGSNRNGTRVTGRAVQKGIAVVYGFYKELSAQAEIQILSPLRILRKKVILPYDPNVVKPQQIQFIALGGDGSYVWHTHNPRLLHINQNGLATTIITAADTKQQRNLDVYESGALLTAHTNVKVSLTKNPKVSVQAEIYFLPPVKLEIFKYNFETALGDYVRLHVAVYAYANETLVPFILCDNLPLDLEFSNQIFQVDTNAATIDTVLGACQLLHLRSTAPGLSQLTVSYKFQDKILKDTVTLSVFEPLSILNPIGNVVVLPIGTSRNIIYTNGPQRIFTLEAEIVKATEYDRTVAEVVEIQLETQNPLYAYTVLCRKVGETTFNLTIYNSLATSNFEGYNSHVTTEVHCVKPRFLYLYATEQLRSSCPRDLKNSLLHLKERDDKIEIEIEVQDAKNQRLMNISSLTINWEFTAGDTRFPSETILHLRSTEEEIFDGIRLPGKDLLITKTADIAENFRIKGVVSRYDSNVLKRHNVYAEVPHFGVKNPKAGVDFTPVIENEIRFMAVNSTLFPTEHLSIFMAKNRRERIPIAQGSGFYDFLLNEDGVITVEYDAKERVLVLTPLRIGNARIEAIDRCLMAEPSYLSISVVAIGAIRVEVPDRVERTKTIEAIVKYFDMNDNLLVIDPFNLEIYALSEDIYNSEILSVQFGDQNAAKLGEIIYLITGNNLGETKIVFNAGSGDMLVSSEAVNIQVFPPMRLYPRNSTLVVGSNVQIHYQGGPQPDVNIVYHVHDRKVISMESAIVNALKLGKTKITGKCVMTNSGNGKEVVISEDTVEVNVVPLLNIQIKTPLIRILTGAVMPAAVWGLPDLSPMVLGTLENMHITWSTNQPDVVRIYNLFVDAGIEYSETDQISVHIRALNPGKAKIQAAVQLPGGKQLTTSVEVVVFKTLELESPKHIKMDWILVAPRSTIQLKTNLDEAHYKTDSNGFLKVTPDGIVRTQDTLGRELIIAKTIEQTLPIGIEVKNVQYILASLAYPTIKLKQIEDKIPRGMNFVLKVSLHDNLGNEFSHSIEDVNDIRTELSHKDIVEVQHGHNLTLTINLPRETSNMIAISLKDTAGVKHAEDYIKLSVAESKHIYPTKTIFSVGDIICFDSPLTLSSEWTSSDEQILSIDRITGVAKVLGNRFKLGEKIAVTNGVKASGRFIKYDVEVRDADVIQLSKSFDIFGGASYRGHLVVRNHLQLDKLTNLIAKNISKCAPLLEKTTVKLFKCNLKSKEPLGLQLLEHYTVQPIFVPESGSYACQIDVKTSFSQVLNIVKTNDVHFELEVQLLNGLTDSAALKFVPGVKVIPDSLFAVDWKDHNVEIIGLDKVLQKVEVKSSDTNLLEVTPQARRHGTLQYKIKILNELPTDEQLFIRVHSPATQQDIQIPVLGPTAHTLQRCSIHPFANSPSIIYKIISNIGLIIFGILLLGVTIFVYVSCNPTQQSAKAINEDAFSTSLQNNTTVTHSTPTNSPQSSPGSPIYTRQSPYYASNFMRSPDRSSVYGEDPLKSPQQRANRRFL